MMQSLQETLNFLLLHPFSCFPLLLFLLFICKYGFYQLNPTPKKNIPPSPPRIPIIGNLHQLGTYPHRSLQALSQKHGDLMLLHLGSKPAIVVSTSKVASQVLKTHDLIFSSRPHLGVLRRLLVNGKDMLSSPYGEHWRQLRSIWMLKLLSVKRVRSFRRVREEEVTLMMNKIKGLPIVNLSDMLKSLSNDVVCRLAFGKKYGGEENGVDFLKVLDELLRLMGGFYIGDFVSWLAWIDRINGVDAKVNQVANTLDSFLEAIIHEHSSRRIERIGDGEENQSIAQDFVDVLLETQEDSRSANFFLDKESIKGLILDIFTAGTVTTAVTLEWMMSELIRNPRIMEKLQEEVQGITGDKETVTEDDLENMIYMKVVIKESLRLHPPAPLTPAHESTKDAQVDGYNVIAETLLFINIWAIGRDPSCWEEPEKFYPERFLDSPIDFKGHDFEFIPFGSGRRVCPGMAFAIPSIELVLANLVHQFDWALPNGADGETLDMMEVSSLVVHRKNALRVVPTPHKLVR